MDISNTELVKEDLSLQDAKVLYLQTTNKHEILFTYLPKINLIEYLCSVGGLISMWLGLSVYDLVIMFAKESKKLIVLLLVLMKCRLFITAIVKCKQSITLNVNQIFSRITIIVFSALMLIQVISIIRIYFDFEVVTRFDVHQTKLIPNVLLSFKYESQNLSLLHQIYPQMKQDIDQIKQFEEINKYTSFERAKNHINFVKIYDYYLLQLLIDNRLTDFHRIMQTKNHIKSCQIKNFDEIKLKSCTSGVFGIRIDYQGLLFMRKHFDFSKLVHKNEIEKINFRLNSSIKEIFAHFHLTLTNPYFNSLVLINSNTKTTVSFSTFLTKKLRPNKIKCISGENQIDFSEDYFNFCLNDCAVDKINQLCGCVSVYGVEFFFNKNYFKNNYKFCNNCSFIYDNFEVLLIPKKCAKICKRKCHSLNFDTKIQVSKHFSNKTILEIIPLKTPRIAYIETWKTDFNQLIYNCGGTLGLWFGITPVKVVDLIQYYIPKIYRISMNVCATVFHFLVTSLWNRIKQNRVH
jgi:hypothetical protein